MHTLNSLLIKNKYLEFEFDVNFNFTLSFLKLLDEQDIPKITDNTRG